MTTDAAWLTPALCLDWLGVESDHPNAASVELCRLAAAAYVERVRPDLLDVGGLVYSPDADVVQGAVLATARLYARKGSPAGLASFGEFGPAPVLRFDSDVERLLGLGAHARPRVR